LVCEEHLGRDGAAEFGLVPGYVVGDGSGLCELLTEYRGEARDAGCGFGEAPGVVGIVFGGLMSERAAGGARGDVDERVRAVGGVEEIALEHHISNGPGERYVVWFQRAEDCLKVVDLLGESGVGEGFTQAGGVERHFDGVRGGDGEAEAAGGVERRGGRG